MRLTKELLDEYLKNRRITLSETLTVKILKIYGIPVTDEHGQVFEYSEQDIAEQLRKIIQSYQEGGNLQEILV